ncbi:uncharacterized protein LOC131001287 isoform X2 [Salvia miltiorrhiza]|uniref:uncharacterized protein LOC131001287 isoform X2 n=1 Tax=Salvia miltiorrhiza TaxID=226208 RepID=UPI0025AC7BA6|nr:uncharacterized protein LOC131001287 isoform X2 [Salvia miltiorrhiza]
MGRNSELEGAAVECCMCGDHGLSSELFSCSGCEFRSQHNNLYPGAETYNICNWCLSQKDDHNHKGEETTKSSQNSSHKTKISDMKIKKGKIDVNHGDRRAIDNRIKKQNKSPAPDRAAPPPLAGRKRVTSDRGVIPERIIRPVFRNKVRRYKLLDEVSS